MIEPVAIECVGDCWNNPEQFQQQLNQHPIGEPLLLDMRSEGPSLELLGVTTVINDWLKNRQQSPDTVHITRWSNPVEFVPYQKIDCSRLSHFFVMVRNYWRHIDPTLEQQLQYQKLFGLFIGRLTMSRAAILYNLMPAGERSIQSQIFASLMETVQPFPWKISNDHSRNFDTISPWLPLHMQVDMFDWFANNHINSVDSKSVRDQFTNPMAWVDTNNSLLNYYNRFAVEIVCETFTLGNTFFPTEKTIRPLMSAKPIMVYGPRYYLARLRGLGFRTYNEIWDESYDLYQGPERWNLIRQSMNRLLECSRADQIEVLGRAHEIAMYNRQHLDKISNYQIDLTNHDYTKF